MRTKCLKVLFPALPLFFQFSELIVLPLRNDAPATPKICSMDLLNDRHPHRSGLPASGFSLLYNIVPGLVRTKMFVWGEGNEGLQWKERGVGPIRSDFRQKSMSWRHSPYCMLNVHAASKFFAMHFIGSFEAKFQVQSFVVC